MSDLSCPVLMQCGHLSNAFTFNGRPVCSRCPNVRPGWDEPATETPVLAGRIAMCKFCEHIEVSSYELDGFEYRGPGSYYACEVCECGFTREDHNWGGRYKPDAYGRKGATNPYICINRGGRFRAIGGDTADLFFCGCDT
jgi:hypothetical protein